MQLSFPFSNLHASFSAGRLSTVPQLMCHHGGHPKYQEITEGYFHLPMSTLLISHLGSTLFHVQISHYIFFSLIFFLFCLFVGCLFVLGFFLFWFCFGFVSFGFGLRFFCFFLSQALKNPKQTRKAWTREPLKCKIQVQSSCKHPNRRELQIS